MNNSFVDNWNPYTSYTVKKKQIVAWHDKYGNFCFYAGKMWEPLVKHLHCGIYKVTFKEV